MRRMANHRNDWRRLGVGFCLRIAAVVGLTMLGGCGKSDPVTTPSREIRGQPINAPVSTNASAALAKARTSTVPSPPPSAAKDDPYPLAGFDTLAGYNFETSDELLSPSTNSAAAAARKADDQIPAPVKALDKKRVSLKGFMLPLKVEGGLVTELLIMKDQSMCCYGVVPKINEWVSVKMLGEGVKPIMDQPVTFFGTLRVGEMRENGYLVGIYALDGEKMAPPPDN